MEEDYARELVIVRLRAIPPNVSFSIGNFGDFSRDQLIEQVRNGTDVGRAAVDMQLNYLREMPRLAGRINE